MKSISFLLCLLLTQTLLQGQMNYWTLPPSRVSANIATPTIANLTNPTGSVATYVAANGAYDENGNLLFYVKDETIYDASNVQVGILNFYEDSYPCTGMSSCVSELSSKDIAIVPIPGTCEQFYVIYQMGGFYTTNTMATKVNCDSGSPVVDNGTPIYPWVQGGNCYAGTTCPLREQSGAGGSSDGLAVSKLQSNNTRYLFTVNGYQLKRHTISASGISAGVVLASSGTHPTIFSAGGYSVADLELSENVGGSPVLAWGDLVNSNTTKRMFKTVLNSSYNLTTITSYNCPVAVTKVTGVEFYPGSNSRVLAATNNGLYDVTLLSTATFTLIASSADYNNTQVELAKNGKMYFVNNNTGKLAVLNSATNAITGTAINMYGNGVPNYPLANVYALPEQIDGENYDFFFGTANAVATFKINGTAVSTTTASFTPFYQCYNMLLTDFINAANTLYRYEIYTYPGNLLATNTCTTWLTSAQIQTNLKLFCNSYLSTATGKHKIRLYAKNACNQVYTDRYIEMFANPGGVGSVSVTLNNGNGGSGNSKNFATPTLIGNQSGTFNIAGAIVPINMTKVCVEIEEWMPNGEEPGVPGWVFVYDICSNYVNGVTQLTGISLNGLQCNPTTSNCTIGQNYFIPKDGVKFRITTIVSNECSSSTDWGYFKPDPIYFRAGNVRKEVPFSISPNPFTDKISFDVMLANTVENLDFTVFDISGKIVGKETFKVQNTGMNTFEWKGNYLLSGLYTYILQVGNEQYRGKIAKVNP